MDIDRFLRKVKFFWAELDHHKLILKIKDEIGEKNYEKALSNPENFVLKPQREGGGNNIYGEDIKPFLENIKDNDERNAYILMDRKSVATN